MTIATMITWSSLIWLGLILIGLVYFLVIWLDRWTDRKSMPVPCDMKLPNWLHRKVWRSTKEITMWEDYAFEVVVGGLLLWATSIIVSVFIFYPATFYVTVAVFAAVGSVAGSLFFARWCRDTKKVLNKCKDRHEQIKKEE